LSAVHVRSKGKAWVILAAATYILQLSAAPSV
jgi:hypothetical protein